MECFTDLLPQGFHPGTAVKVRSRSGLQTSGLYRQQFVHLEKFQASNSPHFALLALEGLAKFHPLPHPFRVLTFIYKCLGDRRQEAWWYMCTTTSPLDTKSVPETIWESIPCYARGTVM
jgi:hypothetical protein